VKEPVANIMPISDIDIGTSRIQTVAANNYNVQCSIHLSVKIFIQVVDVATFWDI
jgi:hypothetical protein